MAKSNFKTSRFGRIYRHVMPIIVWSLAVAAVVVLYKHRSQRYEVIGFAQGQTLQISATCDGRVSELPVELFTRVTASDTVAVIDAVLDNENLQAELDIALARIRHLTARLIPTQQQLLAEAANAEVDNIAARRRFDVDVENARLRILELKAMIGTDRIKLDEIMVDRKVAQELFDKQAIAPYELEKTKAQYDSLAGKIEENEKLLVQADIDLEQAKARLDDFADRKLEHTSIPDALEVINKEILVQEKLVEQILARREPVVLKSTLDGVVSLISVRAGETVMAGEPILTISAEKPSQVVAYIPDNQVQTLKQGASVELVKAGEPVQIARSQVTYVGPAVELLPERLWKNPDVPQWGRPFTVKIPPRMQLIPGQAVGIRRL